MIGSNDLDFSFSGLKTSVRYFLEKGFAAEELPNICASFQEAVVDVLVAKVTAAAEKCGQSLVALSGGVSSNARLLAKLAVRCEERGLAWRSAAPELRTDNGLMIAYAASHRVASPSPFEADVEPNFNPLSLAGTSP